MNLQELNNLRNYTLQKSETPFEKARGTAAYIGEVRIMGGKKWIKTHDGWVYQNKDGSHTHYHSKTKATKRASDAEVSHYRKHADGEVSVVKEEVKEKTTLKEITKEEIKKELSEKPKIGSKFSDYKILSSLGGSSDVKLAEFEGEKYAIKPPREKFGAYINEQNEQEAAVDKIYDILGFGAPNSEILKDAGKSYKISKFEKDYKELNVFSDSVKKGIYKEIQKGFVLDCLLGNWDVIGANKDNILIGPKDEILRIDNGGSLEYRARGSKKPESAFGPEITELKTFLDGTNPSTKEVFDGITDKEIKEQAKDILFYGPDILYEISKLGNVNLTKKVSDRLQWLDKNIVKKEEAKIEIEKEKAKIEDYDKTKFDSKATADYFKDFDSLEIEGNKNIKEGIKAQILRIEKANEDAYKKHAKSNSISVEEYKQKLQKHVENLMKEAQYFRATDIKILDLILTKHGRFKSQFETGTSDGSLSPEYRARAENDYFKFGGKGINKENRPIYGYCSENKNGVNNAKLEVPPRNSVAHYGIVTIKIKKDIALKKATVTFKDSLAATDENAATPVSKPHFTSLKINNYDLDPLKDFTSVGKRNSYTEIQYHNQLKFDDIESVHISPHSTGTEDYNLVNKVIELGRKTNVPIKIFGNS